MAVKTVMGPAGAPMRPPYGSFAGKTFAGKALRLTVMGPAGAPMRPPYGSFAGKAGPGLVRALPPFAPMQWTASGFGPMFANMNPNQGDMTPN